MKFRIHHKEGQGYTLEWKAWFWHEVKDYYGPESLGTTHYFITKQDAIKQAKRMVIIEENKSPSLVSEFEL